MSTGKPGFPFPVWVLLLDMAGLALMALGALGLFAEMDETLGILAQDGVATLMLVLGFVLVGVSLVLIVHHLRKHAG
jgi:hypothetical protein